MSTATATPPVDTQTLVQQAIKKVSTIATLPEVTAKIIKTVEDPKSTAAQLHQIVSHDPALVTRILKVVNSAFYGLPGQIASVERAIVLLGLNAVKNIAVAASLGQLFRGKLSENFSAKDLWTHCIAVAVTARQFARDLKVPIADEAFLAGMIHDIGILVSLQNSPEQIRHVCDKVKSIAGANFCEVEREIIGVDHQQLGAGLAEAWKFPRPCQLVAGFHHNPGTLSDHRLLVALVHVSDALCCQAGQGFNLTALNQQIDEASLSDVKIDPVLVCHIKEKLPTIVSSASTFL